MRRVFVCLYSTCLWSMYIFSELYSLVVVVNLHWQCAWRDWAHVANLDSACWWHPGDEATDQVSVRLCYTLLFIVVPSP